MSKGRVQSGFHAFQVVFLAKKADSYRSDFAIDDVTLVTLRGKMVTLTKTFEAKKDYNNIAIDLLQTNFVHIYYVLFSLQKTQRQ